MLNVTYQTYQSPYGGYGYKILVNGRVVIDQPFIPCISGYRGFDTEQKAGIIADFIAEKLRNGKPPFVHPNDLVNLGVI